MPCAIDAIHPSHCHGISSSIAKKKGWDLTAPLQHNAIPSAVQKLNFLCIAFSGAWLWCVASSGSDVLPCFEVLLDMLTHELKHEIRSAVNPERVPRGGIDL